MEFSEYDDEELVQLISEASAELERRRSVVHLPRKMDALNRELLVAEGVKEGDAWGQPTGAHDAYPLGWRVTHGEELWENLTPGNVWEPGVTGWRVVPSDEGGPADWIQPAGAHDAYSIGDVVMHNGSSWTSTADGNVWEPGVYGWEMNEQSAGDD